MPAGPPIGNKNGEKWTLDKSRELFKKAIDLSNEKGQRYVMGTNRQTQGYVFDFIGEVARELDLHKEIFTELKNKFSELQPLHKRLTNNMEANCFHNTKSGIIKEATGIVNLKSNHKWTDRQQIETPDLKGINFKIL